MVFLLSLNASRFVPEGFEFDVGGGGRAKGLGGPEAPADIKADAEGDGGGRTIWSEDERPGLADVMAVCDGEPPPLSSSASEGIWRLSFGRAPDFEPDVFEREGGANSGIVVAGRVG
jgi:hypothetical protein